MNPCLPVAYIASIKTIGTEVVTGQIYVVLEEVDQVEGHFKVNPIGKGIHSMVHPHLLTKWFNQ